MHMMVARAELAGRGGRRALVRSCERGGNITLICRVPSGALTLRDFSLTLEYSIAHANGYLIPNYGFLIER